jgi:thioredoxin reductase/acylphosphatase
MTSDQRAVVLLVHGTVQGVGFRWWTRQQLQALALEGTATNRPDGTVEIRAEGAADAVDRLLTTLRSDSTPGSVTHVEVMTDETGGGRSVVPDSPAPAVGDGRTAVARGGAPAEDPLRRRPDHEVVVVGGGPAGLAAALVLGRSRRRVLVVDEGAPRNRFADRMHGYLGHDGTRPAEFLAQGRDEVARYGVQVLQGRVTRLVPAPTESLVEVHVGDDVLTARRVLVTTGLRDELPDIAGVTERWGRDVLHCPYCHGWEYRDATLAVVAAAPEEVDKVLTVRQWSGAVHLVLHGMDEDLIDDSTRRRLAATGVDVVAGPVDEVVVHEDRVTGLRMRSGEVVPCDAVVVQPRMVANDDLLVAVGAELTTGPFGEFVVTDETGSTGVPGIWATGNVSEPQSQVVMAAADGYRAAVAIDHDLVMEDVDAAVLACETEQQEQQCQATDDDGPGAEAPGP